MRTGLNTIDAYYKAAMSMPLERLQNIIRGKEHSIPVAAAMMAYEVKAPAVAAASGQQAAQQPTEPSVRDRMEGKMGMLPEDTGIGALPAPNMEAMGGEGMAGGGIVAFADEGLVPEPEGWGLGSSFAQIHAADARNRARNPNATSSAFDRMLEPLGNLLMGTPYTAETKAALEDIDRQHADLFTQRRALRGAFGFRQQTPEDQRRVAEIEKQMAQLSEKASQLRNAPNATLGSTPAPKAATPVDAQGVVPASEFGNQGGAFNPSQVAPPPAPPAPPKPPAAAKVPAVRRGPQAAPPAGGGLPSLTDKRSDAGSDLKSIMKDVTEASGVNKINEQQAGLESLIEKTNRESEARLALRPKYTPYEKYEKSLLKEEEGAQYEKNENFRLALVNAGLAIAGGDSQFALQNIGKGGQAGVEQYSKGLKDLKAAAKERQKAFAMIEEARNAKDDKDFDRYDTLMGRSADRLVAAKQHGIESLAKMLQITVPQATQVYTSMKNNASQEAIAAANNQVQRESIAAHREVGMANAAATKAYRDAQIEGNQVQRQLLAQQRAETAYKDFLATPEGKAISAKAISDPQASRDLAQLREAYMQQAHVAAGLPYTGASAAPVLSQTDQSLIDRYKPKS